MEGSSKRLRKGKWTAEEDCLLRQCIGNYREGKWHQVPLRAGLNRCRKSCRLRWLNYLKPSIKRGKLSYDEVDLLRLHKLLGNRWSLIAGRLPGRTANDIKNYWNTHLSKKNKPCCKTNKEKRNITSPPNKPALKFDVLKPQPRSFSINNGHSHVNGLLEVNIIPPCPERNISNVCENNTTSKDDELVDNLMNEESIWMESFLEKSQEANTLGSKAMTTEKKATLVFDVEQLWTLFNGETFEFLISIFFYF